ncbi:hypothetical protein C2G38_2195078 [Gigaspora rosea]|uniref:Uncharacterized protein n=1 Tax=Gigaspora rosea TaxID=44941 RepID=A0A397V3E5_9GLOM|nr:hypothetical protein C2G38_2195078 [Gigaspora rosea]
MDEGKFCDNVIRWGIAQTPDLSPNSALCYTQKFLPHIRYFQITCDEVLEKIQPHHRILEPELWKDIMAKFKAPNKSVTSIILPPRIISVTAS